MTSFNEWIENREGAREAGDGSGKGKGHRNGGGPPPEWFRNLSALVSLGMQVVAGAEAERVHPTLIQPLRDGVAWGIDTLAQAAGVPSDTMREIVRVSTEAGAAATTDVPITEEIPDAEASRLLANAMNEGGRAAVSMLRRDAADTEDAGEEV
jgi:hypothetical protein